MQEIIALLQVAASLLVTLQQNPSLPYKTKLQGITFASQVIQLSLRTMGRVPPFPAHYVQPSYHELLLSTYLDQNGNEVPLSKNLELLEEYISFGDLNRDNLDDAIVVLKETAGTGAGTFKLAALLNENGSLKNVATRSLGTGLQIFSHYAMYGQFTVDMKTDATPRALYVYRLVGNQLVSP